jgi:predicted dehydrogenase
MEKIRIGLIGAGGWGNNHAQGYTASPNAELVAIADKSLETAQSLAAKYHVPNAYGSAEELLADPNVDAVSIVIPNAFHAETAIKALDAGKPVLLDKPFALSVEQAEQVIAKARETGLTFMMGMNQRFNRDTQILKEHIGSGLLGDVYHAKAHWLRRDGIPRRGSWFGQKSLSGGGPLIDIGVHLLDVCLHLIDNFEPVSVSAATYKHLAAQLPPLKPEEGIFDVEDFSTALVRMRNGATVQLEASWMLHQPTGNRQDVEIYGTKAGANLYPVQLHRLGELGYEHIELRAKGPIPYPHCSRYQHYVDVLLGDAKQLVSWEQSLAVQKILDAIYLSAQEGKEIAL